jgi:hypothetical protein
MSAIGRCGKPNEGASEKDAPSTDQMRRLRMAQAITSCSRLLLHNEEGHDAVQGVLDHLQRITGTCRTAILEKQDTGFEKQDNGDHPTSLVWCCRSQTQNTGIGPSGSGAKPVPFKPPSNTTTQLVQGQPVRLSLQPGDLDQGSLDDDRKAASRALIMPIEVNGEWWGGLWLSGSDASLFEDESILQALSTIADLLGIRFERQMETAENAARDKLAGALEMAGTVCHKLNQPMQVILGYASMVTSGDINEPAQVREIVKMIEEETRRMGIITKNLMGITKYHTVETPEGGSMCDVDTDMLSS